ncbi:MAG: hypothetical protein AAF614_12300 [Chloroflexota bacterium]
MSQLIHAQTIWQEQVVALQLQLSELRPRLIEAEAQLAEQLAAISAFEFKLRARLEPLMNRLESLRAEIAKLRRELRRLQDEGPKMEAEEADEWLKDWSYDPDDEAAASGDYKYRQHVSQEEPPKRLDKEEKANIKQLYRRLARRFHPDLAVDDEDRTYRTDMMMRINAAYAARDLARLEALALEPDSVSGTYSYSDKEMVEALRQEVESCVRRLAEIAREQARLERHESARMMVRAERLELAGRDFFAEMAAELHAEIDRKRVDRDILEEQVAQAKEKGEEDVELEDFADAVFNLGLEEGFVDDDPTQAFEDWAYSGRNILDWTNDDDDILDD